MTVLINQPHPSIDPASIEKLVATFYGRAREDEVIGPIFADAVHDWDHHIAQIAAFWSSVILKTGNYDGRPMAPHLAGAEERTFRSLARPFRENRAGNIPSGSRNHFH